jgi:GT2 family glycosyltransferase
MALPRTAIVILNWNGKELLDGCLSSVMAQARDGVEVIVADNGSSDGSVAWLRERWGEVLVVEIGENLRFAAGNNAGARRALEGGAELLFFLNNDAELTPGALSALREAFAADEGMGIAAPRIDYADRPGRLWYGGGIARPGWAWFAHRAIRRQAGQGHDAAGPTDWATGCALAIRAKLWQRLGGLDDRFYIYAEDVDLSLRARAEGARVVYLPQARVLHHVSATVGGGRSAFKVYHQRRSRWQLLRRHLRPWQWPTALLGLFAYDLVLVVFLLLRLKMHALGALLLAIMDAPRSGLHYEVKGSRVLA